MHHRPNHSTLSLLKAAEEGLVTPGCDYRVRDAHRMWSLVIMSLPLGEVDVEMQTVRCHSPDSTSHDTAPGNGVYT